MAHAIWREHATIFCRGSVRASSRGPSRGLLLVLGLLGVAGLALAGGAIAIRESCDTWEWWILLPGVAAPALLAGAAVLLGRRPTSSSRTVRSLGVALATAFCSFLVVALVAVGSCAS